MDAVTLTAGGDKRLLQPQGGSHEALDIDLQAIAQLVAQQLAADSASTHSQLIAALSSSSSSPAYILQVLSQSLLVPTLTTDLAVLLRPLLIDLTARWIPSSTADWSQREVQAIFHAFSKILYPFQDVYDCLHLFLSHPALQGKHLLDGIEDEQQIQALLISAWRLLYASPTLVYYLKFPLQPQNLIQLWERSTFQPTTRLLAIKVYSRLIGLPAQTRTEYEQKWVGEPSFSDHMAVERRTQRRLLDHSESAAEPQCMQVDQAQQDDELADVPRSGVEAWAVVRTEDGRVIEVLDVWILPILEHQRAYRIWALFSTVSIPFIPAPVDPSRRRVQRSDLSPLVSEVAGVLVLQHQDDYVQTSDSTDESITTYISDYIETSSSHSVLSELALLAGGGQRRPILLTGAPACGKTSLLTHLCSLFTLNSPGALSPDRMILTIQLGDHSGVDAKQLLGSFVSSPTNPGAFEWREGALTRAVRIGMWVVLEDIDRATTDVAQVIGQLVEDLTDTRDIGRRPMLDLGTRGKIRAAKNFQLFATRSVAPVVSSRPTSSKTPSADKYPTSTFLGARHWVEVCMPPPDEQDILQIVETRLPLLAATEVSAHLIATWKRVQAYGTLPDSANAATGAAAQASGSRRTITLRDLLKWCERIDVYLRNVGVQSGDAFSHTAHRERILIEACDVFLSSIPAPSLSDTDTAARKGKAVDRFSALVSIFADSLQLTNEQAWSALRDQVPDFALQTTSGSKTIRLGRAKLLRSEETHMDLDLAPSLSGATVPISQNFAMTKTSLVMLEQIAVATSQAEPILLVGETGTGKTTLVQHLASLLHRPLIALNLSQQTESGDLLGGFKPLDPKLPASEVHNLWTDLFQRTFSAKRNAQFLEAERKAFGSQKWKRLIGLWRESAKMAASRKRRGGPASSDTAAEARDTNESRKRRKTEKGKTDVAGASNSAGQAEDTERLQHRIQLDAELDESWKAFEVEVDAFEAQHAAKRKNFVFSFVEGPLVHAIRNGHWILLDEINLAASEVLHCLSGLLQSPTSSVTLTDRGDTVPIVRHPNFRIFACMNPATDVGKKDLAMGLRQRFTELYIPSPDSDIDALTSIVDKYIGQLAVRDRPVIMDAAETYAQIQRLSRAHELADGANQRPHYSVRTLARALRFAAETSKVFGLRRALYEGFIMAFSMLLESSSLTKLMEVIERNIMSKTKDSRQLKSRVPPMPSSGNGADFVQVGAFWLENGSNTPENVDNYVLTPSVQQKLVGLARAVMTRKYPVLIQGPTSAGKTSAIEYLAKRTGHAFVRINNHEHTDVQEYLGTYATDPKSGQLVFKEGLLVHALRHGHWIVLDELNLAPTDVLEALNRLLDDNRELIIPETGEVVRPHPHFMLFATQNPPGLYAGRKVLSRAFRNRFLEIHFDDVPQPELQTILADRCGIAPSYAAKMVAVFVELQKRRQTGRVFETKQAFVTLRDLFRWGQREAVGYQALAENGYMLIAERARRADDKAIVKEVLEEVMNVRIDVDALYDIASRSAKAKLGADLVKRLLASASSSQVVWTKAMTRLLYLISAAFRHNEPVLLVGETGTGKTSVCEAVSVACGKRLLTVNCHQNTDSADLLGGQRPLRNRTARRTAAQARARSLLLKLVTEDSDRIAQLQSATMEDLLAELNAQLAAWSMEKAAVVPQSDLLEARNSVTESMALFEWNDGPLVQAMRGGDHVLLDEISLADDSVLERLNSVLESGRSLVLTDGFASDRKGHQDGVGNALLVASEGFQIAATMNPGGDYGKKELSPALRNRFTEIWVPHVDEREDLLRILGSRWAEDALREWSEPILDFAKWINAELGGHPTMGIRDMLAWVTFVNNTARSDGPVLTPQEAFVHGALLTVVDGLGTVPATAHMSRSSVQALRQRCLTKLADFVPTSIVQNCSSVANLVREGDEAVSFGAFPLIKRKNGTADSQLFSLTASSPSLNAMRVVRGLCVPQKAILLEGSPGAGKTSLITALARVSRTPLTRINLSDQTELVDLFGSDLPVEGGGPGEFAWRDAAFLRAMVRGEWVLLDEMNLASQSVLEGLNSCLDHRGSVYVPELGRSFDKHPEFRIFAAQNPIGQGGGRKGLPQSFLNRFTKVYVQELTDADMLQICREAFAYIDPDLIADMISFNGSLQEATMIKSAFGRNGSPWEFNLRDVLRWVSLLPGTDASEQRTVAIDRMRSMYWDRFRGQADREAAWRLFEQVFGQQSSHPQNPTAFGQVSMLQIGRTIFPRMRRLCAETDGSAPAILQSQLPALDTLAESVKYGRLSIVIGESGCGKSASVHALAAAAGIPLEQVRMSPGMDTSDLIGSFEQEDTEADFNLAVRTFLDRVADKIAKDDTSSTPLAQLLMLRDVLQFLSGLTSQSSKLHSDILRRFDTSHLGAEDSREVSALSEMASQNEQGRQGQRRFRWADGPFLRALREGHWLLLDDANLCPASVLDRFNSLFEDRGSLVLSERGMVDGEVPVVHPHPKFRAFMTMDPRYGELSRAMRNRGIEVYIASRESSQPWPLADVARLHILRRAPFAGSLAPEGTGSPVTSDLHRRGLAPQLHNNTTLPSGVQLAYSKFMIEDPDLFAASAPFPAVTSDLSPWNLDQSEAASVQVLTNVEHSPALAARLLTSSASEDAELVLMSIKDSTIRALQLLSQSKPDPLGSHRLLELYNYTLLMQTRLLQIQHEDLNAQDPTKLSVLARSALLATNPEHEATPEHIIFPLLGSLSQLLLGLIVSGASSEVLACLEDIYNLIAFIGRSCGGPHLDYSALQIVQERLAKTTLQLHDIGVGDLFAPELAQCRQLLGSLAAKVSLKRGLAMPSIWRMSLTTQVNVSMRPIVEQLIGTLQSGVQQSPEAVRTAVDIAATALCVTVDKTSDASELPHLVTLADQASQALRASNPWIEDEEEAAPIHKFARQSESFKFANGALLVDGAVARFQPSIPAVSQQSIHHLVDLYCTSAACIPESMIRLRAQAWNSTESSDTADRTAAAISSSLRRLDFAASLEAQDTMVGLGQMFKPMALQSALASRNTALISLKDLATLKALNQRSAALLHLTVAQPQTVTDRLSFVLAEYVGLLSQCVRDLVADDESVEVQALARGIGSEIPDVKALSDQLARIEVSRVVKTDASRSADVTQDWLTTLHQVCIVLRNPAKIKLIDLGSAFIKVAQVALRFFWPNLPIDPLAPTKVQRDLLDVSRQRLTTRLSTLRSYQNESTGRESSLLEKSLAGQLDKIIELQDSAELPKLNRPSNLAELAQLNREVLAFLEQVLNDTTVSQLIMDLRREFTSSGQARAATLRSSISNFRGRLPKIGPSLEDVWAPLLPIFDILLVGLSALVEGAQQQAASKSGTLAGTVVQAASAFPTALCASATQELLLHKHTGLVKMGPDFHLIGLHSVLRQPQSLQHQVEQLQLVDAIYSYLFGLWSSERARQQQEAAEAASIYKSRKEDVIVASEEELEEQDFQSLFPDYGDGLAETPPAANSPHTGDGSKTALSTDQRLELLQLHYGLTEQGDCLDMDARKEGLVQDLLEKHWQTLPQALDHSSALFQMHLHARWLRQMSTSEAKEFYREANPAEAQKLVPIVSDLRQHLAKLLKDWPDQLVLQHIQDRCDAILALRSDLPVARTLSALELLLAHTDDWEAYASSKTTLRVHRDAITAQIIAWRRLELASWPTLLDYAEKQVADTVSEWWFSFYEVSVLGSLDAIKKGDEAFETHVRDIVKLVDDFMRTSTIGQYASRLKLLSSFARYFETRSALEPKEMALKLARLLGNMHSYFEQASANVEDTKVRQRKTLEQDIAAFAKLASWKDVNIHALKQSAQKSHRRLHKTIRKFREMLRQPVDPILAQRATPTTDSIDGKSTSHLSLVDNPPRPRLLIQSDHDWSDGKAHLLHLDRTLQVLDQMCHNQLRDVSAPDQARDLQELGAEIIRRAQQLSKATPAHLTEENAKIVKQLTVRKQRAWTDLLKEQRRLGLSSYQNADKIAALTDPVQIFGLPTLRTFVALPDSTIRDLERAERYHWRLLTSIPRSHDALQNRSEDVPVGELLKGIHFVEHGIVLALKERSRLLDAVQGLQKVDAIYKALDRVNASSTSRAVILSDQEQRRWSRVSEFISEAVQVIKELQVESADHRKLSTFRDQGTEGFDASIAAQLASLEDTHTKLGTLATHLRASDPSVLEHGDEAVLQRAEEVARATCSKLDHYANRAPAVSFLCEKASLWLMSAIDTTFTSNGSRVTNGFVSDATDLKVLSNRIIDSVLLIAQDLRSIASQEDNEDKNTILQQCQDLRSIHQHLRVDELVQQVSSLISAGGTSRVADDLLTLSLRRVTPFLGLYCGLLREHVSASSTWYAELLKYLYILNQHVQNVITQGFCKPREAQESSEGNQDNDSAEAGTGLADGSGAQDITDQLQDDEDIEEMQQDEADQGGEDGDIEKQKGAKETGLDLDTKAEEKDADGEDQDADEDQEDEQEPDDAIDKVDPLDPGAVDEKMWDGSKDEEKETDGEMQDETQAGPDDDLSAPKEQAGQEPKPAEDAAQDKQEQDAEPETKNDGDGGDEPESDEGDDGPDEQEADEDAGLKQAPQMDDVQEGEVLDDIADFPGEGDDEMDLDMEDENELEKLSDLQADDVDDKADDMSFDEEDPTVDTLEADDEPGDQEEAEDGQDPDTTDMDPVEPDDAEVDSNAEPSGREGEQDGQDQLQMTGEQDQDKMQSNAEDLMNQDGTEDPQPQTSVQDSAAEMDPSAQMDRSSAAMTGKQTQGVSSSDNRNAQQVTAEDPSSEQPEGPQEQNQQDSTGTDRNGAPVPNQTDTGGEAPEVTDERNRANPIRSLGDALQEFRRRLDDIQGASEDAEDVQSENKNEEGTGALEAGEVEHVAHDQTADGQALGAAEDNEVQMLDSSAIQDDSKPNNESTVMTAEAVEQPQEPLPELPSEERQSSRQHKGALMSSEVQADNRELDPMEDRRSGARVDENIPEDNFPADASEMELDGPVTEPERIEADASLQNELALLQQAGEEARVVKAAELWASYTSLTADLSLSLCEQLRLILAPTLASRLNGDFRTGKRLNMRKIIPFIASDFAKDKIWLRRTKPSAREYQVLLAIDDSKSMAETRSAHLAYQTLALVTGALAKLEVGDVSVCRFGAEVEMLHDFGHGSIGAKDGAKIIERLSFRQRSTNVLRLVEDSLRILGEAREKSSSMSSTAAELWQLQIIISDGVCQDHAKLRAMLRRAAEERVMLVFVIVDALHQNEANQDANAAPGTATSNNLSGSRSSAENTPRNSILTMQQVSYSMGPGGQLDMRLERYLDTFPFDYYVVVRDVQALPDVLAETLRQWAEKIREGS
ncbi:AAA ATPase midasin [Tilletia horrida]|nr:AAA ATPase midasin [Tilletia horrida]KAK0563644.1 AAA ATPase midasin [Tilletia horrida]